MTYVNESSGIGALHAQEGCTNARRLRSTLEWGELTNLACRGELQSIERSLSKKATSPSLASNRKHALGERSAKMDPEALT